MHDDDRTDWLRVNNVGGAFRFFFAALPLRGWRGLPMLLVDAIWH